jgi:hypothetical protein
MSFSIELVDESLSYPYDDPAAPCASGVLILSESKERLGKTYQHNRILLSPRVRSLRRIPGVATKTDLLAWSYISSTCFSYSSAHAIQKCQ